MKNRVNVKFRIMMIVVRHLLSMMAVLLLAIWAVGYIGYGSGGITHLMLLTGLLLILLRVVESRNHVHEPNM